MTRLMRRAMACLFFLALSASSPAILADTDHITLYPAYSDGKALLIEGRIVEHVERSPSRGADGRLANLSRNMGHFFNDERSQQTIQLRLADFSGEALSDNEGYFRLSGSSALAPGWHPVGAHAGETSAIGRLLVVSPSNHLGLISDLDDTILISEVTKKRRLLANTFLKNAQQRQAVPGVASLYTRLMAQNAQPASAPLFYLSASPRQLQDAIAEFLDHHAFPPGVLMTKRVSNDFSGDPLLDQFSYKTQKIEEIFARLPWVRFILVGDDGEKDPEIYDWVREHYPDRVADIWIRQVSTDPQRLRLPHQKNLADILFP